MQAHLEIALGQALEKSWVLKWQAVRRCLNKQSDELATRGVFWAAEKRDEGHLEMAVSVTWLAAPQPER